MSGLSVENQLNIEIDRYSHSGNTVSYFRELKINISDHGFYLLTGESGIGKTTLMKIILGLETGSFEGFRKYKIGFENYTHEQMRLNGFFGYLPDTFSLISWEKVIENLRLPMRLNSKLNWLSDQRIEEELNQMGLNESVLIKYPHELSFGMKARISLLRAVLYKPKVLFLDELYTGLDKMNCDALNKYLAIVKQDTIVIGISHQVERASEILDYRLNLRNQNDEIILETIK